MLGNFELMAKRIFLKIACGGGAHWDINFGTHCMHINNVRVVKSFFVSAWLETENLLLE